MRHSATLNSVDRWLVPGSLTLSILFPALYRRHEDGELTEQETLAEIERRVLSIVNGAMADLGVQDRSLIDDLAQALHERIATKDAARKFNPAKASATTYLRGIARMLIREALWRRKRPLAVPQDVIERVPVDDNQLDRAERAELHDELKGWLDQLSPGEIRALVREFGPIFEYSPPIGRARRLRNTNALPEAMQLLQQLSGARQTRQ